MQDCSSMAEPPVDNRKVVGSSPTGPTTNDFKELSVNAQLLHRYFHQYTEGYLSREEFFALTMNWFADVKDAMTRVETFFVNRQREIQSRNAV